MTKRLGKDCYPLSSRYLFLHLGHSKMTKSGKRVIINSCFGQKILSFLRIKSVATPITKPAIRIWHDIDFLSVFIKAKHTEKLSRRFRTIDGIFINLKVAFYFLLVFVIGYPLILYFYLLSKLGSFLNKILNLPVASKPLPESKEKFFNNNGYEWYAYNNYN